MKSLNKHVPLIVFLLGLGCMIYSMLTFFHPSVENDSPTREAHLPPGAGEIFTPTPRVSPKLATKVEASSLWEAELAVQMHKVTDAYLRENNLAVRLPETMQYAAVADGLSSTLLGAEPTGRIALYIFSGRGSFKARDHVAEVLKEFGVQLAAKGAPYNSRSGMTLYAYKGAATQGYDYLVYLFRSGVGSGGREHALVLIAKGLDRHPAAVRDMVESIRTL